MKKILLIIICMFSFFFISCKENETPNEVYKCVDELLEYIQPDKYAWSYDLMEGELNLTVDFVCKIEMVYSDENDVYYSIFVCHIRGDDVDWEQIK
jgi:hypothetical protein